ncbi:ribosomal protection-like ABC-F family protein [Virgibacillus sp. SK37]|uniref:ribosomal protection-like ABC-F family protein n=1 Tax=Virgibacillus sp. SK37 TaxID=403957 RepID=UPI0004D14560|nr:ABC-F type ribosomal protection protein [Virgibacillus sp. SK37]AIF42192.1 ABC transporter ATP-binding protein [Virgibacillus sp. SK37]
MTICSVNKVNKMYGGNSIFENISFEIKEKDRIGLVGRNGSGKSSLFRLLAGEETPDEGQIHWRKGIQIGYLKQIPDFEKGATTKEVLLTAFSRLLEIAESMRVCEEAMSRELDEFKLSTFIKRYGDLQEQFTRGGGYEIDATIEKIVNGLNISGLLDRSFASLSGGEKTKVGLALILLKQPDLLLLDEPTNHLDLMAVEWLGEFLQEYPGTTVVISHDRYFLDEVITKVLDLEDDEINCYHTDFSGFVKEKEERLLNEFQAYQEQQKKMKKMKEAIKRLRDWANRANPPNEGLHKRARNMERALERMEKLARPVLQRKKMNLEMEAGGRSGKDVIILEEISKQFGDRALFQMVNMHVTYQDHVAIVGENGTGKSTLIHLILGNQEPDGGIVKIGSNVKIGYLSQNVYQDIDNETVIDKFREEIAVTEGEARNILARFLFYGHMVFRKVSQLSGGERMRLRLAQLMHQDVNLLILDEPTNHLDIESREVLEEALEDFNGTILAVSHDRYFLNKLFHKIYWIDSNTVHVFSGNYNWARGKLEEKRLNVQLKEKNRKKANPIQPSQDHTVEECEIVVRYEKEVEKLEQKINELDIELGETSDLEELQSLFGQKQKLEFKLEKVYEQLMEALD